MLPAPIAAQDAPAARVIAPAARPVSETPALRWARPLIAALVFGGALLIRFLDPFFVADGFVYISGGRQIVAYGEMPLRDFVDPGHFFLYYLSAAAQVLSGYNLLGEAVLDVAVLAAAASLTFLLSARAARSTVLGLGAAVFFVATFPRLYNHYKLFLLVACIWLCWRYADRRTTGALVLLAVCTAATFGVRTDFAVYFLAASLTTLAAIHWADGRDVLLRRVGLYGAIVAAAVLPFLLLLQANGGVLEYYRVALEFGLEEKRGERFELPRLSFGQGVLTEANAGAWWFWLSYALPLATLGVLFLGGPFKFGLTRVRSAGVYPPPLTEAGDTPPRYGREMRAEPMSSGPAVSSETARILVAAVLSLLAVRVLVTNGSHTRLSDAGAPLAVLGAWLVGRAAADHFGLGRRRDRRALAAAGLRALAVVGLLGGTWAAVTTAAGRGLLLERSQLATILAGPASVWDRGARVLQGLQASPVDERRAREQHAGLSLYLRECTLPDDRLFLTWYAPELYFYAGRGYGGAVPLFHDEHFSSPATQDRIVAALRRHAVPIVLAQAAYYDQVVRVHHTAVHEHLASRYSVAYDGAGAGPYAGYRVLVDRDRSPSRTYGPAGLPCFAPPDVRSAASSAEAA